MFSPRFSLFFGFIIFTSYSERFFTNIYFVKGVLRCFLNNCIVPNVLRKIDGLVFILLFNEPVIVLVKLKMFPPLSLIFFNIQ